MWPYVKGHNILVIGRCNICHQAKICCFPPSFYKKIVKVFNAHHWWYICYIWYNFMLLTHHNRYYIMFYLYIISVCVLYCICRYCLLYWYYLFFTLKNNNKKVRVCETEIWRSGRSGRGEQSFKYKYSIQSFDILLIAWIQ